MPEQLPPAAASRALEYDAPRHSPARRWGRISLNQAARLSQSIKTEHPVCPSCGDEMHPIIGTDCDDEVWLLRCEPCALSFVIKCPAGLRSGPARGHHFTA